ncbi:hypothetical protein AVEN_204184-1 [Araneus ventricosus]|uniref:Uncharacterized protein n=1 Tax=Araneus ventricosus TaxID=182803 RepID=A0A4Y2PC80_ARAVE|nr:hypothetical protein AVEN_204184-1 [Araneus ventricosus]
MFWTQINILFLLLEFKLLFPCRINFYEDFGAGAAVRLHDEGNPILAKHIGRYVLSTVFSCTRTRMQEHFQNFSSTTARTPASESPENTPEKPRYPLLSYFSIFLSSGPRPLSQAEAPPNKLLNKRFST